MRFKKTFFIVVVAVLGLLPSQILAQSTVYLDPADKLTVHSPAPFSMITSPMRVELEIDDDEQNQVTYNLILYKETNCSGESVVNQIGQVAANSGVQSISVGLPSSLGRGCLEVCVGLQADKTLYPVCNQRVLGNSGTTVTSSRTSTAQPVKGEFSLPALGSILSGEFNRVQWEFESTPNTELTMSYRLVGANQPAKLIAKLPASNKSFIWNVTEITNGQYYLEIETQINGSPAAIKSPVFLIDNPGRATEITKPLIVVASPLANSNVTDQRPVIAGTFITSPGDLPLTNTFLLEVNGEDRTSICKVNTSGFSCQGGPSLIAGLQKVRASYRTLSQQTGVAEWVFTVNPIPGSRSTNFGGIHLADVNWLALAIVILLIFLIIFLPWFVWTRWKQRTIIKERYFYDDYEPDVYVNNVSETKVTNNTNVEKTEIQSQPTTIVSDAGYVDPTAYSSYEDYLKAVSQKLAESEKTYVVATPAPSRPDVELVTAAIKDENMINVPDYEANYSTTEEKKNENKSGANASEKDNTPEWLRS